MKKIKEKILELLIKAYIKLLASNKTSFQVEGSWYFPKVRLSNKKCITLHIAFAEHKKYYMEHFKEIAEAKSNGEFERLNIRIDEIMDIDVKVLGSKGFLLSEERSAIIKFLKEKMK